MATSPNYAWAEPDNSSLVKNGASDIRTLGDAIDTSVWNVGFGQAGKNKLINADFRFNQRAFTSATTEVYGFDRWLTLVTNGGGTVTSSAQTFTAGTAPVSGYEAINFYRCVTASQTGTDSRAGLAQRIEDVRTFAGQTITVSLWAKAGSGTPNITVSAQQRFGTGGSTAVFTLSEVKVISTSWARYSFTLNIPSIAGKTIVNADSALAIIVYLSAGSDLNTSAAPIGVQNNTFDIWGVQAEYGSKATPFQTATGSIQGELAACQRYYFRATPGTNAYGRLFGGGQCASTTRAEVAPRMPVTMRIGPTSIDVPSTITWLRLNDGAAYTISAITLDTPTNADTANLIITSSGMTTGRAISLDANNNTGAFIGFSAEF